MPNSYLVHKYFMNYKQFLVSDLAKHFVNYLNDHVIKNGEEKAAIVQVFQDPDYNPDKEMRILYF